MTTDALTKIEAYLDDHRAERLRTYEAFLRIPSISALPEHAPDVREAAQYLADDLTKAGLEHVEVSETGGHPIVYADWLHADGGPTAIVYGHYDVQPVDPLDRWQRAPFEPFQRDGRMFGRGAADDKGQIQIHVRAAEALLATEGRLPVNVRYVFEGEEESTSEHLDGWLEANRPRLGGDVAIISDTGFFQGNLPAMTISLRGIMYAQIDVEGPTVDLHSGEFGGMVENPANALATIVAALKGPDGRIRIPGFYDDVGALTEMERDALAALPFDEEMFRQELGVPSLAGEIGYSPLERRGARPTLDVNGLWGGFQGGGTKTIIPAHAHAQVSCRLVSNQDPERVFQYFQDYVLAVAQPGVRVTVQLLGTGRPSITPIDHPATKAAARAIEKVFGRAPLYIRDGGSIPIADSFQRILGLPVVLTGYTNPDDNAHAPNESLILDNFEKGIRAIATMLHELVALNRSTRGNQVQP
jgi:acetylornithine deacetylase/succinyl-diaminopimelate desuccinylase-like protein